MADVLYNTGRCLLRMNNFATAKENFEKAQKIRERISSDIATDINAVADFSSIGYDYLK